MLDNAMTTIELAVIALARHDPLSSVMPPGRFAFRLFGPRPHQPLANPRLEALRRYAVLFRLQGHDLADIERERISSAGYAPREIDMIESLVSPTHGGQDRAAPATVELLASRINRLDPPGHMPSGHPDFPSQPASTASRGAKSVRMM